MTAHFHKVDIKTAGSRGSNAVTLYLLRGQWLPRRGDAERTARLRFAEARAAVVDPHPHGGLGRVARTKQVAPIVDMTKEPAYVERQSLSVCGLAECRSPF
jgi:hypothetical protein